MIRTEEVFSFAALWDATRRAARGKRRRASVARFRLGLEPLLLDLRDRLREGRWWPSAPELLEIHDPKPRTIAVLPFSDRVVHQCLYAVLEPRLERRFIGDTYACRKGFGTHAALRRARGWARSLRWFVHLDIAQYFPSADHAVVRSQFRQDLKEPWLLAFCEMILAAGAGSARPSYFPGDDLFSPLARLTGLPLGNLTSQLWANRLLDPVDHLVKDRLRFRCYLRYMDDMLLLHDDRTVLEATARRVEEACHGLRLRLHPWEVGPTHGGVGFVGYRVLPDRIRVRRSTVARAERRMRRMMEAATRGEVAPERVWEGLRSTMAHWSHADSWRLKGHFLRRLGLHAGPPED
jgi:hypothetical protein